MEAKTPAVSQDFWYPTEEEAIAAQRACCGRVCKLCEAPAAYAYRKRTVDLADILHAVIDNELTEKEREAVALFWFEGCSLSAIAQRSRVSVSSVHRRLNRAMQEMRRILRYVVMYQCNLEQEPALLPLAVQQAMCTLAAKQAKPDAMPRRLQALREKQALPLAQAAKALGMSHKRLARLESAAQQPTLAELQKLAAFYATTIDYVMQGDRCYDSAKTACIV